MIEFNPECSNCVGFQKGLCEKFVNETARKLTIPSVPLASLMALPPEQRTIERLQTMIDKWDEQVLESVPAGMRAHGCTLTETEMEWKTV